MRGYPRFVPLDLRGNFLLLPRPSSATTFLHGSPSLIGNNPLPAGYDEEGGDTGVGLGGGGGAYKMVECMAAFVIQEGSQALRPQT